MPFLLFNPGSTLIELAQAGITIQPNSNYDVTRRIGGLLASSDELAGLITQGRLRVRRSSASDIFLPVPEALRAIRLEPALDNLTATGVPVAQDDESRGYSFASLWRFGTRVWMCYRATAGAAIWTEMVPSSSLGVALGRYYGPVIQGETNGGGQLVEANRLFLLPYHFPTGHVFNRIGFETTSSSGHGGLARIGIYSSVAGNPTERLVDFGTITLASNGARELSIHFASDGRFFWVGFLPSTNVQVRAIRNGLLNTAEVGSTTPNFGASQTLFINSAYSAGLPAVLSTAPTSNNNPPPFLWFRTV